MKNKFDKLHNNTKNYYIKNNTYNMIFKNYKIK